MAGSFTRHISGACNCPTACSRTVSPAGVEVEEILSDTTPNDHFIAAPDSRVKKSSVGCVVRGRRSPTIRADIVSAAGVQLGNTIILCATPYDHFTARPHRYVPISAVGRISRGGGYPTVTGRIVSPTRVHVAARDTVSTPNNHLAPSPYGRVAPSRVRRIGKGCT
jgi:hypothetical protein